MPAALAFLACGLADRNSDSAFAPGLDFQLGDVQQLAQRFLMRLGCGVRAGLEPAKVSFASSALPICFA